MDARIDNPDGAAGDVTARELLRLPVPYAAPLNALEQKLCDAFSQVLRVEPVGRDDEFYDLGGDSLAGEALSIEIQSLTGQVFAISSLFRYSTPGAIAQLLGGELAPATDAARFFIVHGRGGYTALHPDFRAGLAADRPVTMFELPGIRGDREPIWKMRELAQAYVDQLQREQPEGPIRLAAFCAGSFIALEMADLLREAGRPLDRLVLVDPLAPPEIKSRHEAETALEQAPGSLTAKEYFRRTGRWRDDAARDEAVVAVAQRQLAEIHLRQMGEDQINFANRYKGMGFADWPRAVLLAMYRFAWPKPFTGKTYILASEQRVGETVAPGSLWQRFTPNVEVTVLTARHSELIVGEAGTRTAARIEEAMAADL